MKLYMRILNDNLGTYKDYGTEEDLEVWEQKSDIVNYTYIGEVHSTEDMHNLIIEKNL